MLLDEHRRIHGDFPGAYKIPMVMQGQRSLLFKNCLTPLAPEHGETEAGEAKG